MSRRKFRRLTRSLGAAGVMTACVLQPAIAAACGNGEYPAAQNNVQSGINVDSTHTNCSDPHWKVYSSGQLVALRFENTSGAYYSNARNQNVRTCTFSAGPSDPYLKWVTWNCTASNHSQWFLRLRNPGGSYAPDWSVGDCNGEETFLIQADSTNFHLHLHFSGGADTGCPPDKLWSGRMTVYAK